MDPRLPPLTSLRAFEAASRLLSFKAAAEELNVTPAALSFQIKTLEDHLGIKVFTRLNRSVELTEAGRALKPGVHSGFETLQAAWRRALATQNNSILTVTAGPAFTAKWLAPRLFSFAQLSPEIDLRFSAALRFLNFETDDVDIAIRFSRTAVEGLFSIELMEEWVAPMMTPELAARVKRPADLLDIPLLVQEDIRFLEDTSSWPSYFEKLSLDYEEPHGARFSQADHAVDAALSGAGAILGRISLTHGHLEEGRLVRPFEHALSTHASYKLVCKSGREKEPHMARFIEWIIDEIKPLQAAVKEVSFL